MSYHTFAYTGTIGTSSGNVALTAVPDGILYVQSNSICPGLDINLYGVGAVSATMKLSRIISPSIRQIANNIIRPINIGQAQFPDNPKMQTFFDSPLKLRGQELILVDAACTAASEVATVVFHAGTNLEPVPMGDPITIRATGTTTLVAGQWTQVSLVYDDTIPVGQYALVNATFQSTTCLAGRCTFDGQFFRPGSLGLTALGNTEHAAFQQRRFGIYGRFRSISLPRVEYLATSADTAQTVFLQIIKIGP